MYPTSLPFSSGYTCFPVASLEAIIPRVRACLWKGGSRLHVLASIRGAMSSFEFFSEATRVYSQRHRPALAYEEAPNAATVSRTELRSRTIPGVPQAM